MNKPTPNRPGGNRVIDAPFVFIDLPHFLEEIKSEPTWEKSDRNAITIFKSGGITIVLTALRKDAVLDDVSKEGTVLLQVINGRLSINETDAQIAQGQMLTIHEGHKLRMKSETDSVLLLTVVRELSGQIF